MLSRSRPWLSVFSSSLRSALVVGAVCYLGARDKIDSTDLTIILTALGGGVSLPYVVTALINSKKGPPT